VKQRAREGDREASEREEGYGLQGDAKDERDETRMARGCPLKIKQKNIEMSEGR
jgi:hypothetical protein